MMHAFYYDAPGSPEIYDLVGREIGTDRPAGLVLHLVTRSDTGLRHLDVWETREQWETYRDSRVRPAVAAVLERLHVPIPPAAPPEHPLDLVDLDLPAA